MVGILLDERYYLSYTFIPILSFAYLIHLQTGLLNPMFYQEKRTLLLMYIIATAAAVNILLNFLLIPEYGGFGAAWATVIAVSVQFLIEYYFARKVFFIPFDFKKLLIFFLPLFILELMSLFVTNINQYLSLGIKMIMLMGISVLFYYINKEKIDDILKLKKNE